MKGMKPTVHIVIVTYNGNKWIDACLQSIAESRYACHTWIIDNHSQDDTLKRVAESQIEKTVIRLDENLGFGKANNLGISNAIKAAADYVFLLNQDAYLFTETLDLLVNEAESKEYDLLSPMHLNGKGDLLDKNFGKYYTAFDANSALVSDAFRAELKATYSLPFVNAAAWLIPVRTLMEIGGFDPLFIHYGEDDQYCQRMKFHQKRIGLVSKAFIRHDREDREQKKAGQFSEKALSLFRRKLKVRYANLNAESFPKGYEEEMKRYSNWALRNRLKLDWTSAKGYAQMAQIMKEEEEPISESRMTCQKKGPHFLNV